MKKRHNDIEKVIPNWYHIKHAQSKHLNRFGPKRLPTSKTNPKLIVTDSAFMRLVRADPSKMKEPMRTNSAYFLADLFPDEEQLVCMGPDLQHMVTKKRCLFDFEKEPPSLIVPAYMTALTGLTSDHPNGTGIQRISCRCLANTGDARFVVYCAKGYSLEDQACGIIRLASDAPLVMVVMTAMGSLDAWFSVVGWSKRDVSSLRSRAVKFGSWRKTRIACHPYHVPGGRYDLVAGYEDEPLEVELSDEVHRVVYYDPAAIGTVIRN